MATEVTDNGTVVTSVSGSAEDATTKLPEGVTIQTSNTSKLEVNPEGNPPATTKEGEGEDPNKTAEGADQDGTKADPDTTLETDIQEIKKAEEDLKGDLQTKGINFADLEAEFEKDGKLSDASYLALEKAGYPKSAVDAYTTGLIAKADQFVGRVTELAGGPDDLKAVSAFIANQGEAYVNAFNEAVGKGSLKQIELVIKGAKADMVAKFGTQNESILGGPSGSKSQGFATQQEMVTARSDHRYARDRAYTEGVRAKVAASSGIF